MSVASHGWMLLRGIAFAVLLLTSIVLPSHLVYHSIAKTVADLDKSGITERRSYGRGCIGGSELWFPVSSNSSGYWGNDTGIRKVSLKTGIISDIQMTVPKTNYQLVSVGDEVYAFNAHEIRKPGDPSAEPISANDGEAKPISNLFSYAGRPACIFSPGLDQFWIAFLKDGKWNDRRDFHLPKSGRVIRGSQTEEDRMLPLALRASNGDCTIQEIFEVSIAPSGQDQRIYFHARVIDGATGQPVARRFRSRHIESVKRKDDVISTLAAENSESVAIEWEEVAGPRLFFSMVPMAFDNQGMLLPTLGPFRDGISVVQLRRRLEDGSEIDIAGLSSTTRNSVISDWSNGAVYIIEEDDGWNTTSIRRIEGESIGPVILQTQSNARQYLGRWRLGVISMMGAWLLHYALVSIAVFALRCSQKPRSIEFDLQQATLAPVSRRLTAATLDLSLLIAMLFLAWTVLSMILCANRSEFEYAQAANRVRPFVSILATFFRLDQSYLFGPSQVGRPTTSIVFQSVNQYPVFYGVWIAVVCGYLCATFYIQIRHGMTPGKWLTGTRCTRTDFSSPGVGASVIRGAIRPFEFLFFLTPIPAMCLMLMTNRRFGDFLAETTVIKHGSVRSANLNQGNVELTTQ